MIRHLLKYVRDNFSAFPVRTYLDPSDSQECVVVTLTGGPARGYPDNLVSETVQILVQHRDELQSARIAAELYGLTRERHAFDLPAPGYTQLTGVAYDPIDASPLHVLHLQALQSPAPFGRDGRGLFRTLFNLSLTYVDSVRISP